MRRRTSSYSLIQGFGGLCCGVLLTVSGAELRGQEAAYDVRPAYQDETGLEDTEQYTLVSHRPSCRHCAPNCCTCMPGYTTSPGYTTPAAPGETPESPSDVPPTTPQEALAPGQFAAGDTGTYVAPMQGAVAQLAPNMIGDFFGGGGGQSAIQLFRGQGPTLVTIPSPGTSSVGRVKLAENVSPIPRDRVFVNYSYFDNVPLTPDGVNVNRFVPGFEKTFLDGTMSFEVRFPFASTLSSNVVAGGPTKDDWGEFGNLSAIWKTLLHVDRRWVTTAGLQLTVPTADDVTVS